MCKGLSPFKRLAFCINLKALNGGCITQRKIINRTQKRNRTQTNKPNAKQLMQHMKINPTHKNKPNTKKETQHKQINPTQKKDTQHKK